MRARLLPADAGPAIELDKDLTLVGRDSVCDVRLGHKSVSKLHCILVKTDGLILVRDLGSTNGTRVNGTRVRRGALLPNDWLMIATLRYLVKFGSSLEAGDTPPPPADLITVDGSGEYPTQLPPAETVGGSAAARVSLPDR